MSGAGQPREDLVARLLGALHCARLEHAPIVIPLASLPAPEREEVDRVCGEGAKSALVHDRLTADIHDTLLPGIWRTRLFDPSGRLVAEELEVGEAPHLLADAGSALPATTLSATSSPTVTALVRRVLRGVATWRPGDPNVVIPVALTAAERHELARVLGVGPVVATSRRLGHCEQRLTHLRRVWWLRYLGPDTRVAVETLEVGEVPSELRVPPPELDATEERLLASLDHPGAGLP